VTLDPARREHVAAVIDVGSNSVLLLVVAVDERGRGRTVDRALATTRLGRGLHAGGALDPAARAGTLDAAVELAVRARRAGAEPVLGFATGAARDARDGRAFVATLARATSMPVEILTGEDEARLAFEAAQGGLALDGPVLVADVGGRTTELALGDGRRLSATVSLPLGALSLTEANGGDRLDTAAAVDAVLARTDVVARARDCGARLVGSGGTATALAALALDLPEYAPERVQGHVLRGGTLAKIATRLAAMSPAARDALPGLDPGRGAILPAGATVLDRVRAATRNEAVVVSDFGVRHGYLRAALARAGVALDLATLSP